MLKSPTAQSSPATNKAELAMQQQQLEAHVLESLEKLRNKADNNIAKHRASVQVKLLNLQEQLEKSPSPAQVSGRVWEAMGQVWAEAGNFTRAIGAYRYAVWLRCRGLCRRRTVLMSVSVCLCVCVSVCLCVS